MSYLPVGAASSITITSKGGAPVVISEHGVATEAGLARIAAALPPVVESSFPIVPVLAVVGLAAIGGFVWWKKKRKVVVP